MRVILGLLNIGLVLCRPQFSHSEVNQVSSLYSSPADFLGQSSEDTIIYDDSLDDIFSLPVEAYSVYDEEDIENGLEGLEFQEASNGYGSPLDDVISSSSGIVEDVSNGLEYGSQETDIFGSPSEEIVQEYGSPESDVVGASSEEIVSGYGSPQADAIGSPSEEVVSGYGYPQADVVGSPSQEVVSGYGSPQADAIGSQSEEIVLGYGSPKADAIGFPRDEIASGNGYQQVDTIGSPSEEIVLGYRSPQAGAIGAASEEVLQGYGSSADNIIGSPSEEIASNYGSNSDNFVGSQSASVSHFRKAQRNFAGTDRKVARQPVVKILKNQYSGPNDGNWNYAYEAENGIRQEARGEMRSIGENTVSVMSGSYSYIGADGQVYQVDWYADETGFHPSAPHLPKPVEIPFPEVAAAVASQLRFAAEQEAAASENVSVSATLAGYGS